MTIAAALTRIDNALTDGRIARDEWAQIQAELRGFVPTASEPARRLLAAWEHNQLAPEVMADVARFLRSAGYALEESVDPSGGFSLRAPDVRAERIRRETRGEDDPDFARLATEVGVATTTRETVAVLDDGFDLSSPLLITRGVEGRDLVHHDDNPTPMDHGTATASIAATGDPRLRVMPLEVLAGGGAAIAEGIDYAAAHGVRVMNMSFRTFDPADVRVISEAMRRHPDVTFVLAAGNDGGTLGTGDLTSEVMLSANALPNCIVVAASDRDGSPAGYTNRGEAWAHIAARGSRMLVPERDGRREVADGTSLAAPRIASLVARLRLLAPDLRPEQLRQLLLVSSNRDERWASLVACGGSVNELRAENTAAAIRLLRAGVPDDEIVRRLRLSPATSTALLRDARLVLRM